MHVPHEQGNGRKEMKIKLIQPLGSFKDLYGYIYVPGILYRLSVGWIWVLFLLGKS